MVVISVSLSGEELAQFDRLVAHFGYDSRSSAVRDALYHFIAQHRMELSEGALDVVLTLVYAADRHQDRIREAVHAHGELIRTSLHSHLGKQCVDLLVVRGDRGQVHELLDQLTRVKDVRVTVTSL